MADMGIEGDPNVLQQNPNVMAEAMRRSRPQEPQAAAEPKTLKAADGSTYWITGPKEGQRVVPGAEAPEVPEPEGKTIKGADGFNYWLTGSPKEGQKVLPNVDSKASPGANYQRQHQSDQPHDA